MLEMPRTLSAEWTIKTSMVRASASNPRTEVKAAAFLVERKDTGQEIAERRAAVEEIAGIAGISEVVIGGRSEALPVAATIVEKWGTSLESADVVGTVVMAAAVAVAAAIATTHTGAEAAGEAGRAPGRGLVQDLAPGEDATAALLRDPAPGPGTTQDPSHAQSLPGTAESARAAVVGVNRLPASTRAHRPQGLTVMLPLDHPRPRTVPLLLRGRAAPAEAHLPRTELQPTAEDLTTFISTLYNHVLNNRWVGARSMSQSKQ